MKRFLLTLMLLLLTVCMFVACKDEPEPEESNAITFVFYDATFTTVTDTKTQTIPKNFTKWGDVLTDGGTLVIGDVTYTLQHETDGGDDNAWLIAIDESGSWVLYTSTLPTAVKLIEDSDITDKMTVYCVSLN